jgi:hypothetical protein
MTSVEKFVVNDRETKNTNLNRKTTTNEKEMNN